mmetsp:Transcript_21153/g.59182  ORF Transcript_21153/g.59182 Transcript_21153/m.59182 type:complete len:272 (-) Transcript_21153:276-1091(-)
MEPRASLYPGRRAPRWSHLQRPRRAPSWRLPPPRLGAPRLLSLSGPRREQPRCPFDPKQLGARRRSSRSARQLPMTLRQGSALPPMRVTTAQGWDFVPMVRASMDTSQGSASPPHYMAPHGLPRIPIAIEQKSSLKAVAPRNALRPHGAFHSHGMPRTTLRPHAPQRSSAAAHGPSQQSRIPAHPFASSLPHTTAARRNSMARPVAAPCRNGIRGLSGGVLFRGEGRRDPALIPATNARALQHRPRRPGIAGQASNRRVRGREARTTQPLY